MTWVSLLTDFGTIDYYVGAMKGTLLRLAPEAQPIDLSHEVPPGDVEAAADLLAGAAPTFPPGTVHCAVVDPGVGSARGILALEAAAHFYVAPDNGLLSHLLDVDGARAFLVERTELFLDGPGATFHGRDRFVPVAAALARGEPLESLGEPAPAPVRLAVAPPERSPSSGDEDGALLGRGRVGRVDRFGNLVTDLPAAWAAGASVRLELAGRRVDRRVSHYAELPAGEPGWLVGSRGTLELSLRDDSLAERWKIGRGEPVRLVRSGSVR